MHIYFKSLKSKGIKGELTATNNNRDFNEKKCTINILNDTIIH